MGWVVKASTRPFYPREIPSTNSIGGRVGFRASLDGYENSRPHRDLIPRSFSRYQVAIFFPVALRPDAGYGLILEVSRSHTTMHYSR